MMRRSTRRVHILDPLTWPESINENVDWKLLLACTVCHVSIAREALSQGANVNCRRSDYLTPLHIAVQHNDVELIQLLCNHPSIDIEAKTVNGLTSLHKATLLGHRYSVEILIEYGATVNCTDSLGRYPLHYAALHKDLKIVTILIINGARVNVYDAFHESPLYTSIIRRRCLPLIKLLLSFGATITSTPDQMCLGIFLETVLFTRSTSDMEIVDLLYRNGADVNAADFIASRTPMHIVAMTGNSKLATYLIERGADLNRKNKAGLTPLETARLFRQFEIAQLIENRLKDNFQVHGTSSIISLTDN